MQRELTMKGTNFRCIRRASGATVLTEAIRHFIVRDEVGWNAWLQERLTGSDACNLPSPEKLRLRNRSGALKPSIFVPIFVFTLASPVLFYLGPVRLSPYRLVLIATFIPCLIAWLSGSVGRIRLPDIFMLATAAWGAIVLLSHHGMDGLQTAGIFVIETFGPFLFAKRYIRDVIAFQRMVKYLALMVIFLLPFAIYENVAGSPILIQLFGSVFSVYDVVGSEARFGLRRAQGTFEHFILFGVVCSTAFALSFYVFRSSRLSRLSPGFVAMAVVSSLSSGAILSVVVQAMLIGWDKVTAAVTRRWAILADNRAYRLSCRGRHLQP